MRSVAGLVAAVLSGLAVGASSPSQPSADVYLLTPSFGRQRSPDAEKRRIPKEVARHILLQRTARLQYGGDLRDLPDSVDIVDAIGCIVLYGLSPAPLSESPKYSDASQLVVILEGAAAEQSGRLGEKLGRDVAFTIPDPPSATANDHLMALCQSLGVASTQQCDLPAAINPFDADCWPGRSLVVKYDLRTSPKTLDSLFDNLDRLQSFVSKGDLEVMLVVFPESTRSSPINHWSDAAAGQHGAGSDLRRRADSEAVISDQPGDGAGVHQTAKPPAGGSPGAGAPPAHRSKHIPQCFASLSACTAQTNACSGHGKCVDKYAARNEDGVPSARAAAAANPASCFVCVCNAEKVQGDGNRTRGERTVHWAGNMCQKEDVSVQFWLLAGFSIAIVGAVTFAIGLLFSVGEEPLPGVIGAGVSRSK